jgi:DNA replication licensing factor MCM4
MVDTQNYSLNLDCAKLKAFEPSMKLYYQLVRYPQEVIPLMDHALTEIFLDRFEDLQIPSDTSIKVRPFNMGKACNMRDLNPSGMCY